MKKLIAISLSVFVLLTAGSASAITIADLQAQIAALTAQLNALIAAQTGGTVSTAACSGITSFDRSLTIGSKGNDVKCLQSVLNQAADTQVAATGVGSAGNETSYFGGLTRAAVSKFQAKYGISPTAGYFGPLTRAKANTMLGAGGVITPPVTGAAGLSVYLAPDTPVSTTIADAANGNFTKFTLTAGPEADVSISKIYLTRSGLTANADLENIKIVDASTGSSSGSVGSLNVDNRSMISFIPNLVISKGTTRTFYIRAGIVDATTAGKTAVLGIASASEIVSNASAVTGTFPVNGNAMSVVALTIGSLTVGQDGTLADSQPDVGATGIIINQFKTTTGSTEGVTIETITAKKYGSHSVSDIANIELYDVTNAKSLGKVTGWNSDDKAVWTNLNLSIDKGKTYRFKIKADIVNGAGSTKTVNADLSDGSDVLIVAKGNTYGFFITPTSADGDWASAARNGQGANDQTIQNGSLNISKAAKTPATGNISAGDGVKLAVFNFQGKGEEIKITKVKVTLTATGFANSDITRVALYDKDDKIVAGPGDPSAFVATFTDTFIVPVGGADYTVKVNIADSAVNGYTIIGKITDPSSSTNMTATGMTSNNTITPTPAANVSGNTLTLAGGSLIVTTQPSPAGRAVPKGISDHVFATFSFDAGASGEDMQVTAVTVSDSLGSAAAGTDINNAELWADLTDANSTRGDVYETKISNTEQWTGASADAVRTQAFTLSQTLVVPAAGIKRVGLIADLDAGAGTGSHSFSIASDNVTDAGAKTGKSITPTYNVGNKQNWTTSTGSVTVTNLTTPSSAMLLGGTKGVELAKFKLTAANVEDMDLDAVILTPSNANYIETLYLYNGTTLMGSVVPTGTNSQITWNAPIDGLMIVPANGYKELVIKADLFSIDESIRTSGTTVRVGLEANAPASISGNNIQMTGIGSGTAVSSSQARNGNAMYAFKAKPVFAKNASFTTTALAPSSATKIAVFDVTADGTEDIVFSSTDADSLQVNIDIVIADTANTGAMDMRFTLKDEAGKIIQQNVEAQNSFSNSKTLSTAVIFRFGASGSYSGTTAPRDITVTKGTTKRFELFADTRDLEDTGDSIVAKLKDDFAGNVGWSLGDTSTTGPFTYADLLFQGEITGPTLTK